LCKRFGLCPAIDSAAGRKSGDFRYGMRSSPAADPPNEAIGIDRRKAIARFIDIMSACRLGWPFRQTNCDTRFI
jgi:hypothetical protein